MMERKLTAAEIMLFAGTRVAIGVGVGLLLSNRINRHTRKGAGVALVVLGGLTTIPLAMGVVHRRSESEGIRTVA